MGSLHTALHDRNILAGEISISRSQTVLKVRRTWSSVFAAPDPIYSIQLQIAFGHAFVSIHATRCTH